VIRSKKQKLALLPHKTRQFQRRKSAYLIVDLGPTPNVKRESLVRRQIRNQEAIPRALISRNSHPEIVEMVLTTTTRLATVLNVDVVVAASEVVVMGITTKLEVTCTETLLCRLSTLLRITASHAHPPCSSKILTSDSSLSILEIIGTLAALNPFQMNHSLAELRMDTVVNRWLRFRPSWEAVDKCMTTRICIP
jgi:hypothetical protein